MENIKIVVVGDGAVGKTSLLITYTTDMFPGEFIPYVYEQYSTNIMVDEKSYNLELLDTPGPEGYDKLRPRCYPKTDIFFVCFSVANMLSFEDLTTKWIPEIDHHVKDATKIIVGCKADLKESMGIGCVPEEKARELAERQGTHYCETSALKQKGLKACFETAIRTCVRNRLEERRKKCVIV